MVVSTQHYADFDVQVFSLTGEKFLIGRAEDCDFQSDDKLLSRHHCLFQLDSYAVRIRDLGSKNGTFVNSRRIQFDVVLNDGDIVAIGGLTLRVVIPTSDDAAAGFAEAGQDTQTIANELAETQREVTLQPEEPRPPATPGPAPQASPTRQQDDDAPPESQ